MNHAWATRLERTLEESKARPFLDLVLLGPAWASAMPGGGDMMSQRGRWPVGCYSLVRETWPFIRTIRPYPVVQQLLAGIDVHRAVLLVDGQPSEGLLGFPDDEHEIPHMLLFGGERVVK